ncbi:Porphobilinogen deaminase [Desulfamplus magnetovallimortis]|uniref:Porphobilinogen deaminase n=1 Tax=Desulfamplus magnetovallimortis TaxID=1246637 RepID=A0A1W1H5V1_9BACT|nr:hydroxymethylbilane synthase [Desulfamplus magnetovallimortis]SLM27748.1 Porphobilinogen deaminase [Desulfamplus magnetovallimortis]
MNYKIKIGTRGSQLALWQANWVKQKLEAACKGLSAEIVIIKTTGDRITDRPLAMVGGKGLFVKEIEQQLMDKDVDIAVHSMKDMPGDLPSDLHIGAVPVRENPFDVLISRENKLLTDLPNGAKIGTSSLRRASQIKHKRPDINPVSIRGNLDTRLKKLDNGEYDAIILAAAGLIRLGMVHRITQYLDETTMLPAVGQGALCIESRENDPKINELLKTIDDPNTRVPVEAERAFLKQMEGSCHIPVACFGKLKNGKLENGKPENGKLELTGLVASEDGSELIKESLTGDAGNCRKIGIDLAKILLERGAKQILENIKIS